jgi:hypothetical protein
MRTVLLLFGFLVLSVSANAQTRDSLIINLKDGQTRKIDLADIRKLVFELPLAVNPSKEKQVAIATYPNPTSTSTTINFELAQPQHLKFEVVNELGQLVRVIEANCNAGSSRIEWDGLTADNTPAANGSYYYRALVEGQALSGKLIITR